MSTFVFEQFVDYKGLVSGKGIIPTHIYSYLDSIAQVMFRNNYFRLVGPFDHSHVPISVYAYCRVHPDYADIFTNQRSFIHISSYPNPKSPLIAPGELGMSYNYRVISDSSIDPAKVIATIHFPAGPSGEVRPEVYFELQKGN